MSLDDLAALTETFGPGGGIIVAIGMLAMGLLIPVVRRERQQARDKPHDLVPDTELLVFMTRHQLLIQDLERRVEKLERKCGD